jgi:osmotically-inducible protein OsmY
VAELLSLSPSLMHRVLRARQLALASLMIFMAGCTSVISATTDKPITSDPSTRTMGSLIDDETIETKTVVNIRKANPGLEHAHLVAVSYNGVLLLAGQAPTAELRMLAAQTAAMVQNVRRVHNELTVGAPTGFASRSSDSLITSKVKSKLLARKDVPGSRIKVVTENGAVYLLGLVTRSQADAAAEAAQTTGGVQKVVRIFEYIDG